LVVVPPEPLVVPPERVVVPPALVVLPPALVVVPPTLVVVPPALVVVPPELVVVPPALVMVPPALVVVPPALVVVPPVPVVVPPVPVVAPEPLHPDTSAAVNSTEPAKLQRRTVDKGLLLIMDVSLASIKGHQLEETGHRGDPSNLGFSIIPCGSGKVVETSFSRRRGGAKYIAETLAWGRAHERLGDV
jgi:hypothetical protein